MLNTLFGEIGTSSPLKLPLLQNLHPSAEWLDNVPLRSRRAGNSLQTFAHEKSQRIFTGLVKVPFIQGKFLFGTPKDMGPPYGKRDPYYSHTIPILGGPWKSHPFIEFFGDFRSPTIRATSSIRYFPGMYDMWEKTFIESSNSQIIEGK